MEVIEAEEVGSLLEEVQQAVLDPQRFCRTVKLKGFQPFTTAENALENVNAISEQMVTDDLKVRIASERMAVLLLSVVIMTHYVSHTLPKSLRYRQRG